MTNQFILNAALLLIFVTTTFSQINISPDNSDIRYTGRWNFDDPSIPFVTWQGSSIKVKFNGTGISIDMSGERAEQFRVIMENHFSMDWN